MPPIKGRKPIPGLAESEDQAFAMIAALTSELCVARERLDTLERVLAGKGVIAADAVEAFVPGQQAAAARDTIRRRIIAKIFRPMRDTAQRAAAGAHGSMKQ